MSKMYVVINPDGSYAGSLCHSLDEAKELAGAKLGRVIGEIRSIPHEVCDHIHCPVNAYDCPYFESGHICSCENPIEECDDFAVCYDENEDYYCNQVDCVAWGED